MFKKLPFKTLVKTALTTIGFVAVGLSVAAQDKIVPERRLVITHNMDFFGADLQPVFETTFANCQQICLRDSACNAFTFNFKANACFPKSEVTERQPFEGASSAEVLAADPQVLRSEAARLQSLSFLPGFYFSEAREQAHKQARRFITGQRTALQLVDASRNARKNGNIANAIDFLGASLNITDAADGWAELAQLATEFKTSDSDSQRELQVLSTAAAINAFVRAQNPEIQVTALAILARGLEKRGRGRKSIFALRLAQSISPRLDNQDALERAVKLFGFSVAEHQVDNNAANPRICVNFSEPLVKAGTDYGDFVRLPESGLVVDSEGKQLCISGVRHGERYRFTLRAGLPAQSGETLIKSVELSVYVRDRDPSVRFVGRAFVLPKSGTGSIPIVTVNLDEVDLKIHRVGDRNILRSIQNNLFGRPLAIWDEQALQDTLGEEVWSGVGEVGNTINQDVTTALPVGDAVSKFEPGVYVLRARVPGKDVYDGSAPAQWFIVTDLGLATMSGSDGLHVFARSLNSANAKPGSRVQLIARNNTILGETTTDERGYAHFAPGLTRGSGGALPALVTVQDAEDFAFLNLKEAAFDLSDRGVEGRVSPPPVDVFLSTDRGAYRVGETVFATALARDGKAEAIAGLPLTAIITRPDGVEFTRTLLEDQGAGGRVLAVPLPRSAARGTWSIGLHADVDAKALTTAKFLVEDFLPERIDFDLELPNGIIRLTDSPMLKIDARYLYGAPGANLAVSGETKVGLATGIDGFADFEFGLYDDAYSTQFSFIENGMTTDDNGVASLALGLPPSREFSRPLQMTSLIRLAEGSGRPVERTISRALAPDTPLIGIKPLFDGVAPEGGLASFSVVAVGTDLKRTNMKRVDWVLNRVETRYQWYESYGNWNYEPVVTRERVANGTLNLTTGDTALIEAAVDWGEYELKLESVGGEYTAASTRFYAGWFAPADSGNTPDTLDIGLDKDRYLPGDTAMVRLVPRFAGKAVITVVSNRLIDMKTVDVVSGENLIPIEVTPEWGAGAYVTASVIAPLESADKRNPTRSLGLNWAGVDPGLHRLSAEFLTSDEVSPRGPMSATLHVDGIREGETAYVTIAAVDVGILNLTAFDAPDPDGHYFGQRKLGMALRDVYGRLIDGSLGGQGAVRSGGDGPGAAGLQSPPPTEELVSFFSGPLAVAADGTVTADFDLPEFNGTVRLMAVVWSQTGVGQAEKDVLVRDPIVMTASAPRFLAPFDQSRVLIELAHVKGPTGNTSLSVNAGDGLRINTDGLPTSIVLNEGERRTFSLPIAAPASGTPQIEIVVTTPAGQRLVKTLVMPVRANDPEIARTTRVALNDGDTFTLDANAFAGMLPGTGHATLAVGPLAQFDAPGLLSALDRYPYGCTEQITSKAIPLLYFDQVAGALGLTEGDNIARRIDQAIAEVLSNQSSSGSFGLWRPNNGDLWLDSYVSDFLSRARARGFIVPHQAFRLAMDNLRNRVNYAGDFENAGQDIAYSLMVLAREGAANIGDLRYYADTLADEFATPLALAQLGTALASYGDQTRADAMFRKAERMLDRLEGSPEEQLWRVDYGTHLRDTAAVLTLAVEAGTEVIDRRALALRITNASRSNHGRSTQENMWSLMAANALIEDIAPGDFTINGQPVSGPLVRVIDAQDGIDGTYAVTNHSGKSANTVLTTYGVPVDPEPAGGNGYSIDRFYFTMDGEQVSPDNVALNTRLVVLIKVEPTRYGEARLMINDPLPAGFEIDNPNLLKSGDIAQLDWLLLNANPETVEYRADRFLAAVDWSGDKVFQLAYFVRAISPGSFHHPAASVEDMYRPEFRARTGVGTVVVTKR